MKKILLATVYSDLYHGRWVGLAPYILRAYVKQYAISSKYEILVKQFHSDYSEEKIIKEISEIEPDIIGLSLYVYNSKRTLDVVNKINGTILLGGPQVTGVEKEILAQNGNVDIIVTGEGEKTFLRLLEHFAGEQEIENIPGITSRTISNKPEDELIDLNTIPSVYQEIVEDLTTPSNICFETSRGCPFKCGYCAWSFDKKMRYYNIDTVLDNLRIISSSSKVKVIQSSDSSLFCNKQRAKKILSELIRINPKQEFYFELNIEHVDDELIELMAQLPNQEFSFGLQAVDGNANKVMGRNFNADTFRTNFNKMSKKLKKAQLHVDIIFPLPGDTLEGFKRSIEFALSLDKLHYIKFNTLILLPGSEFFKNKDKYSFVLRDEETRLVESCYSFSKEDLKEAIKFANFAVVLHSNTTFKKVLMKFAEEKNMSVLDSFEDLFVNLPFDLFDGEDFPEMITETMTDDQLLLKLAPTFFNYGKMVRFFRKYSNGKYKKDLKGWRKAFLSTGPIEFRLLLKLIARRIKMIPSYKVEKA